MEDFIKVFGLLSSAEEYVREEAGASHSMKEYLSFQLVRWIKWPSSREERGKGGEREFERVRWGDGESFVEEMCHRETQSRERVRIGKMLHIFHLEENETIRMT